MYVNFGVFFHDFGLKMVKNRRTVPFRFRSKNLTVISQFFEKKN